MKLIIEENEQKMSESAMHILLGAMMQDKRVNISLTAGRSPINLYKMMVPYVKDQEKFKDIQYYLLIKHLIKINHMAQTVKKCNNYSLKTQIFLMKESIQQLWKIGKLMIKKSEMLVVLMLC